MYCPRCGQERVSEATSFCSRCGYLLTGTAELLLTGGAPLTPMASENSPRSRGIKMGVFMFLLTFLVAPILGMISVFLFRVEPWPMGVAIFLLGGGGLLRIIYAMMFESKYAAALPAGVQEDEPQLPGPGPRAELRTSPFVPPAVQTGDWREPATVEPHSVTENTTKLLEKESDPPAKP